MRLNSWRLATCLFLILMLPLIATACGGDDPTGPENVFIADEADNGQTVSMTVGDMLQVTLEENQSTGYLWSIVTNDEEVLRSSDAPAYDVDSDADGAGGRKTFMFQAAAPGTSTLRIVHAMTQETAVQPDKTFELMVQVGE